MTSLKNAILEEMKGIEMANITLKALRKKVRTLYHKRMSTFRLHYAYSNSGFQANWRKGGQEWVQSFVPEYHGARRSKEKENAVEIEIRQCHLKKKKKRGEIHLGKTSAVTSTAHVTLSFDKVYDICKYAIESTYFESLGTLLHQTRPHTHKAPTRKAPTRKALTRKSEERTEGGPGAK